MSRKYESFIKTKVHNHQSTGFDADGLDEYGLFDWQEEITAWACRKGRAAIFADCGLGKTIMQLAWADQVCRHTDYKDGTALVITPLAVSRQTEREAEKFGITARVSIDQDEVGSHRDCGIHITNYEKLHHFDPKEFCCLVLDESSILKSFSGKVRRTIQSFANQIEYRLACTATPSPNDFMEIGTHSEFVGDFNRNEMLSTFFVHDSGDVQQWRLKGHSQEEFWKWMATWCVAMKSPEDIGYDGKDFILPELKIHKHVVESKPPKGSFFPMTAQTLNERRKARKDSLSDRVSMSAKLANESDKQWLIWCNLNVESESLSNMIPDAVEVTGSDSNEHKEKSMLDFAAKKIRVLVTKPRIGGFGMNWQNCSNMIFVGLSDSYEQYYQAMRRCWRFGQENPVDVFIVTSSAEGSVVQNIARKEKQAAQMFSELVKHVSLYGMKDRKQETYNANERIILPTWLSE